MAIARVVYGIRIKTVKESAKVLLNEVPEQYIWDLDTGGSPDIVIGFVLAELENSKPNTDQACRVFYSASEVGEDDESQVVQSICDRLCIKWEPVLHLILGSY